MSVKVKVPTQLRELTGGNAEVEVESVSSIRELFAKLGAEHPQLAERLVDEQGQIRRFVNVYVGDEDVRFLEGLDTKLEDSTQVSILPAVAGGASNLIG